MDASVSLPDPGEFHRGHHNGHTPGLVIGDLTPFDDPAVATDDTDVPPNPGVFPLDAADVADLLAAPDLGPGVAEEQARILEAELRAELDRFDRDGIDALGGSYCNLAHGKGDDDSDEAGLLPGFEALTWGDLRPCPEWCTSADLPVHGDGYDTTPEPDVPHRGVPRDIPAMHGGQSIDHAGRAEVSLQLEQDRDLATGRSSR